MMNTYSGNEYLESERNRPDDPLHKDSRQTIMDVLRVVALRRWFFFIPCCVGLTAAFLVSHNIPRRYIVRTIFERRVDPIMKNVAASNLQASFDTLRRSMSLDLMGREALRQAVLDLNWAADLPRQEDGTLTTEGSREVATLIADMEQNLRLKMLENSSDLDLVEVSYAGQDPVIAADVLNRLRDNYLARTRQRLRTLLSEAQSFFDGKVGEVRGKTDAIHLQIEQLAAGLPEGLDPRKPDSLDAQAASLRVRREDIGRKQAELESKIALHTSLHAPSQRIAQVVGGTVDPEVAALADRTVVRLQGELDEIKTRIKDLQTTRRMKDSHPDVQTYVREQARLERMLVDARQEAVDRIRARGADPGGRDVEAVATPEARQALLELESVKNLHQLNVELGGRLDARLASLEKARTLFQERAQKCQDLQKEEQTLRASLLLWEDNLASVSRWFDIEGSEKGSIFRTIEPARPIYKPYSPRSSTVFIFSFLLAVILGITGVLLAELFDSTLRTANHVIKSLEIPIIEGVSEIVTPEAGRRRFWRRVVFQPVLAVCMLLMVTAIGITVYLRLEKPTQFMRLGEIPGQTWSSVMSRVGLGD